MQIYDTFDAENRGLSAPPGSTKTCGASAVSWDFTALFIGRMALEGASSRGNEDSEGFRL